MKATYATFAGILLLACLPAESAVAQQPEEGTALTDLAATLTATELAKLRRPIVLVSDPWDRTSGDPRNGQVRSEGRVAQLKSRLGANDVRTREQVISCATAKRCTLRLEVGNAVVVQVSDPVLVSPDSGVAAAQWSYWFQGGDQTPMTVRATYHFVKTKQGWALLRTAMDLP